MSENKCGLCWQPVLEAQDSTAFKSRGVYYEFHNNCIVEATRIHRRLLDLCEDVQKTHKDLKQ
jgi:hypothetical protein